MIIFKNAKVVNFNPAEVLETVDIIVDETHIVEVGKGASDKYQGNSEIEVIELKNQIVMPGDHVICAVTGQKIPLDELKYWNFKRQEPYIDAEASLKAELRNKSKDKP